MGLLTEIGKQVIPSDVGWRWVMFSWVVALTIVGAWAMGWTPIGGGPVQMNRVQLHELTLEVAGVKDALVCSNLKTDIEKNRSDLYAIEREIEMQEGDVTDRVRIRRNELSNTLRDNEARFDRLGCLTELA